MLKPVHVLSLSLLAAAITTVAQAADTTSFAVTLTITKSCDIDTEAATDVEFGTHAYSLAPVNLTAAGSLSVNCSVDTPYEIELNNGANFSGSRRMTDGSNFVPYALNLPNTSTIWDDTNTYKDTGNGAVQVIPVNGVVTNLNFPAGSYSDTVIAKVTF